MDRYGLQIRGKAKNGPLTGWISQKAAFAGDEDALASLLALYRRQCEVETLIADKQVALGMTLRELTRILGAPTTHPVVAEAGKSEETAIWTRTRDLDLGEAFAEPFGDLGVSPPKLPYAVETGRLTATLQDGAARTIDAKLDGEGKKIPEVPKPVKHPFLVKTAGAP